MYRSPKSLTRHPVKTVSVNRFAFNATTVGAHERAVVFDEGSIATHVGRTLSPHVMDLIEIVAAIHVADRMSRRPSSAMPGNSWSRDIRVHMGVRDLPHWRQPYLVESLQSILLWLTDDRWEFDFSPRLASGRTAECVQFLFDQAPGGDVVALFSGGLDSVAGIIADVDSGAEPIALSVGSNGRMRGRQRAVLAEVNRSLSADLAGLPVELHLRGAPAVEQSQRARGLAFLGLAGAAAASLGLRDVHVYENGIGAINLPYTAAQTGAHGTHSMHPLTLAMMEGFLSAALDTDLRIANRSQFRTKAEMCRELSSVHWSALRVSQSCDTGFAARVSAPEACGLCTSCLLRRQSLHGAGLGHLDLADSYRVDALDPALWPERAAYPLRAMVWQVAEIARALESNEPQVALVERFPDLALLFGSEDDSRRSRVLDETSRLLGAYVNEWKLLPSELIQQVLGHRTSSKSLGIDATSDNPGGQ